MLFQRYTGAILDASHGNYALVFRFCGLAYLVALLLFHLLAPRLEPPGARIPLDTMPSEREDR
jgi:ACS family hexuronate transporter-like MFS transporter